LVACSRLW